MNAPIRFPSERVDRASSPPMLPGPVSRRPRLSPVATGGVIIAVLFIGLLIWAGVASISGAVIAPGSVRVESNKKTVKHPTGGIVRTISVREGDLVRRGQVLMTFDSVKPQAQLEVLRNDYDVALARRARFQAELARSRSLVFPPELVSRAGDPRVAQIMQEQRDQFESRNSVEASQVGVLRQRIEQLNTTVSGLRAQIEAVQTQSGLIGDELTGLTSLYERGYAPKTRVLALQRSQAGLAGRRGELISEVARAQEQIGEARIQIASVVEKRQNEAADGLTAAQGVIAEALPQLRVAEQTLDNVVVRSPVDGHVLNLTQFTENGVVGDGELLLDVVPLGTPLVVQARVAPRDIDEVTAGMRARVQLTAYSSKVAPPMDAQVATVSADRLTDQKTGADYFDVLLTIDPEQVKKLRKGIRLSPGMPANVMILTRSRTVLDYLVQPVRDVFNNALREQ